MIHAELIGKEHLVPFIRTLGGNVKTELEKSIGRMTLKLTSTVKQQKLSGQVLRNRTGNLRQSINYRVTTTPTSITGIVGTNLEYAHVHEYGFNGVVTVREHMRRSKAQMKEAIRSKKKADGRVWTWTSAKGKGSGTVMVRAHERHMKLPERSFLRSALREMQGEIQTEIQAALTRAITTR